MRNLIDLSKVLKRGMSIAPASRSPGTTLGTALDWRDSPSECLVEISVGAVASGASAVITLQQSSNNESATDPAAAADTYADITDGEIDSPAAISVTIDGDDADSIVLLKVTRREEKYLRAKAVVSGDAIVFGVNLTSVLRDNMA